MSLKAISWAFEQDLTPSACKFVLVSLADHADVQTGQCWPSIGFLAKRCCMTERSIFNHLAQLEKLGKIKRINRWGRSNVYQMLIDGTEALHPEIDSPSTLNQIHPHPVIDSPIPATVSPRTVTNRQRTVKEEPSLPSVGPTKYVFESGIIKLTKKNYSQWKSAFSYLNLDAELVGCTGWAAKQEHWFPAVAGLLAKKNREQMTAIEAAKASGKPKPQTLEDIIG